MNTGEVAAFLSFNNTYYFTRMFKKEFQLVPSEYIKAELYRISLGIAYN